MTDFTHPLSGASPPTGEHFTLHRSARSPGNQFVFTWTLAPGKSGPGEHRHPSETHNGDLLSGELAVWIDGKRHDVRAGEHFTIPAGASHRFKNFGKVPAVVVMANDGPMFEDFLVPIAIEMQKRGGKMSARMFV